MKPINTKGEIMSTEIQTTGNQYLDLIRQVVTNPDVPVEKIRALWDMQILTEDREAEKQFDAAMIKAQADVQALRWDKVNTEKNSRNVSYPKIDKMLRPVRERHGFTMSFDTEPGPSLELAILCCDVSHTGGHRRRYRSPMPIDGQGPKGGGVMTKSQAVNSGTSYGMRNLAKMIFNIPMMVDKDDVDGNAPTEFITKQQAATLKKMAAETKTDIPKFCEYFKAESIDKFPAARYDDAVTAFNKKRARITDSQAADLVAIADEIAGFDVKKFCEPFGVKTIANIPADKHSEAVKAMEALRK